MITINNSTRVFLDGTIFFTDYMNPYSLMAQRGTEVHHVTDLDKIVRSEAELRQFVRQSEECNEYYLNTLFNTTADNGYSVKWAA